MAEYIGNGGQTYQPFRENTGVKTKSFEPLRTPEPPLPEFQLTEAYVEKGYVIQFQNQHVLPGVTSEMMDWFWANMEKGYYLWAPGSHKSFRWLKEPWKYGCVNSAHVISETFAEDAPVFGGSGMVIHRLPMDVYPLSECLEHVICEGTYNELGELGDETIHMWQDCPEGCLHVKVKVINKAAKEPPVFIKEMLAEDKETAMQMLKMDRSWHGEYETSQWPVFLPTLYRLWKDHPDPTQSVPNNMEVEKTPDGKWKYKYPSLPVVR